MYSRLYIERIIDINSGYNTGIFTLNILYIFYIYLIDIYKISKYTNTSINNMATSSNPEPTVVLYKSNLCKHCTALSNIWDAPPVGGGDSVTSALKKVNPKLRFYVLTAKDNTGKFDENIAPKDLVRYGKWFPMILLIPGRLWDTAMSKLGPKNDIQLVEGVQIMNGMWDGNELKYVQKYDIRKPSEFDRWLREATENEDFKRLQNNSSGSNSAITVPTLPPQSIQPIQPLFTNIVRPTNTSTNYVASGQTDRHSSMEPSGKINTNDLYPNHGDICSMRIISRPS
jgi:hypothetical protein